MVVGLAPPTLERVAAERVRGGTGRRERDARVVGGWWAVCVVWGVRGAPVNAVAASWWLVRGVRACCEPCARVTRVWGVLDWRPEGFSALRCAVCVVCVPCARMWMFALRFES